MVTVLLFSMLLIQIVDSFRFARFTRTNILINNCDETRKRDLLTKSSRLDCAFTCNQDVDCRRYLYCSSDLSCQLYLDGTDCIMRDNSNGCSCYKKNIGCHGDLCTCPWGHYGNDCDSVITDCTDGYERGIVYDGEILTTIKPIGASEPFQVVCILNYGGYTTFLSRVNYCDFENFNRTLKEYEDGFGTVYINRWIGLKNVLNILNHPNNGFILNVHLLKTDFSSCQNYYDNFEIGSKVMGYALHMDSYTAGSTCGDSLMGNLSLLGNPFSTYDVDNTGSSACGKVFGGGWWFANHTDCTDSFLTGTIDGSIPGVYYFWNDDQIGQQFLKIALRLVRKL